MDESCSIDIPDFYIATKQYCATLAHKVAITLNMSNHPACCVQACHSFTPNSAFNNLYHPRFGRIMAIFAKRDIV